MDIKKFDGELFAKLKEMQRGYDKLKDTYTKPAVRKSFADLPSESPYNIKSMLLSVNLPDGDGYTCYYTDDENDFASFVEDYTLEGMSNDYDCEDVPPAECKEDYCFADLFEGEPSYVLNNCTVVVNI